VTVDDGTFVPDEVMRRLGEGIALRTMGERAAARDLLGALWDEIGGEDGDAFHRVAIAHSMADVQDELEAELAWDVAALRAADALTDERLLAGGMGGQVIGLYPSLHLNLGECYRRLGDLEQARHHLGEGQRSLVALEDDGYATMVRNGLDRLAYRLA
jgi:tetratricopeptide (TPR) repeat protein